MIVPTRCCTVVAALLFFAVLPVSKAVASEPCTDLPPSRLLVYDIAPADAEQQVVASHKLDQAIPPDAVASRHVLMLSVSNVATWFEIRHRVLTTVQGMVCNAPELVRIGFGASKQAVFLAQEGARNDCVRRELLNHHRAHVAAFEETVDQFIDARRRDFQQGVTALKSTPAPDAEVAMARWNQGLEMIVQHAKAQLIRALQDASAAVDRAASLTTFGPACGGEMRRLEQQLDWR